MSKGWAGNFFEDFSLGMAIPCPTPRTIGSGETALYTALTGDRTARFCGPDGRIHPLLIFHQVLGQTVRHVSLNAIANLGYAELVFHRPAFSGETVHTEAVVIGLKENSSGNSGIVWLKTTGRSAEGDTLLSYVRWVMIRKRTTAPTTWLSSPVIPSLAPMVQPGDLFTSIPDDLPTTAHSGASWRFSDYRPEERIFHQDGHTVTPGDHMSFTRLFQNSARVHFDAQRTEGSPLVFGGYAMSIGYAQMLNGLDNRLGLAAINGGVHANPVHAGDTLYSMTEILETEAFGDAPIGALRCRLVVFKDLNPAEEPDIDPKPQRHHGAVVLDLDLWELVEK